jgi:1,2-diacylglycerol-3-alpha-glucose alpha-1,2-glucosyltransferase
MKVCLYLEAENVVARSGFKRAFESHKQALRLAGVEVTTEPNREEDYDLLHLHAFGPKSFFYLNKAKREGIKVVVHAHSVGAHDFRDSYTMSNLIAPLYEKYLTFFYEQSDAVFTPSEFARTLLRQSGLAKRIEVVSNGVNRDRFRFSPERRALYRDRYNLTRFTVFSAGNVLPRKGIVDFVRVADRLPLFHFVWYGHRWSKVLVFHPQMDKYLEERPFNMIMPGFVTDTPAAFSAGDVLFFSSHTETQGMVILEAASLGRPLVVRDLPEYRDWLIHGVNCLKGRTESDFVEQLRGLEADPRWYRKLAQGAVQLAEQHSLEVVGQRLKALYRSVLEQPAQPSRLLREIESPLEARPLVTLYDDLRRHSVL